MNLGVWNINQIQFTYLQWQCQLSKEVEYLCAFFRVFILCQQSPNKASMAPGTKARKFVEIKKLMDGFLKWGYLCHRYMSAKETAWSVLLSGTLSPGPGGQHADCCHSYLFQGLGTSFMLTRYFQVVQYCWLVSAERQHRVVKSMGSLACDSGNMS